MNSYFVLMDEMGIFNETKYESYKAAQKEGREEVLEHFCEMTIVEIKLVSKIELIPTKVRVTRL